MARPVSRRPAAAAPHRDHPAGPPRGPALHRAYAAAAAAVALGLLGSFALRPLQVHTNLPFVAAVAVAAWYGGRGPGLAAGVLAVAAIAVVPDGLARAAPGAGAAVYLASFFVVALVVGATTESLRRARAQAEARSGELQRLASELEDQMHEVQTLSEDLQQSNDSLADALSASEDLAAHAMRLQEVTAALSQAQTEGEVAEAVLERGLAVVEGVHGLLVRVDGARLEVIRASGQPAGAVARLPALPHHDGSPLARAVATGEPVWLRTADEHRAGFPSIYGGSGAVAPPPSTGILPLRHGGEAVGALAMTFADPDGPGEVNRAFALLLAQAAADALVRARSYDAERVARRGAEVQAQARADVLGIVAHDLRNPLGVILSGSGLLLELEELPPEQRRKFLEMMRRAGGQMNRLIGDLLDATRLDAGRLTLDLEEVDAREVVEEGEDSCRAGAEEARVVLRSRLPERGCLVQADRGRLLQVVGNLVGNALKFTPAGGSVTLSARPGALEVVFSVADTGPGIPPEHLSHLFDSFWQARSGDRRGVGLGLAITRGIVEAHGGRIWVESVPGAGSTFSFALPLAAAGSRERRRAVDVTGITVGPSRTA
ncbi:MAG TPA: ATP-binding protein [Longimicrobiaceae bacterium]|jgi:signal transduction histidine kinase